MRVSMGKKLGFGFGVVVVIMIIAGGLALYQLNKTAAAFRNVSEHEMTAALAAFGMRANFDEMVWATKNILLRGKDKETFSQEMEIFNYKKDRLEQMWRPVVEKYLGGPDATEEQRRLYDAFKREYAGFLDTWERALPIYQSRGREAADGVLKGKGREAYEPLIELVRSLRAKALKDMEEAAVRTRTAVIINLVAFVVAVAIAVIATVSMVRELAGAIEGAAQARRGMRG
jgi:CHASE3 domain sensor protein